MILYTIISPEAVFFESGEPEKVSENQEVEKIVTNPFEYIKGDEYIKKITKLRM